MEPVHTGAITKSDGTYIRGKGVKVLVADTGIEVAHPDLEVDVASSFAYFKQESDPTPYYSYYYEDGCHTASHGTAVAGLIAAKNGNYLGPTGVAPSATVIGYSFFQQTETEIFAKEGSAIPDFLEDALLTDGELIKYFFEYANGMQGPTDQYQDNKQADIINQSYGLYNTLPMKPHHYEYIGDNILREGVSSGRDGRGYIYVVGAGNWFDEPIEADDDDPKYDCAKLGLACNNAAYDPSRPVPYTITVSAIAAGDEDEDGNPRWPINELFYCWFSGIYHRSRGRLYRRH